MSDATGVRTRPRWQAFAKRAIDVLVGVTVGVIVLPVLALAAMAIAVSSGRPVIFRQERIGLEERPFLLFKLRTMVDQRSQGSVLLTDADRVTRVGEFLRRTSIDELPQLWNVVRGDMSLVGPRPLLAVHLSLYTLEQRRRHQVRPGLTGLAQLSGRRDLPFSQRFALDVKYVDSWTLRGDLVLLARTAVKVLRGSGTTTGQQFGDIDDIGLEEAVRRRDL